MCFILAARIIVTAVMTLIAAATEPKNNKNNDYTAAVITFAKTKSTAH